MFSRKERISRATFARIFSQGRTAYTDKLSLRCSNSQGGNQYSFVVSAKVSKLATARNLLKRRGRYIIRKHADKIEKFLACIFFFKLGATRLNFSDLEKEFLALMLRAGIIHD